MGAFEGLRVLRRRRPSFPDVGFVDLVDLVRRVDPHGGSHDYEAAFQLDPIVAATAPASEAPEFYQHCIEAAIPTFRPLWGRTITLGRRKFFQKLSRDEVQCFRAAGLLEEPPTTAIVTWWDRVAATARSVSDFDSNCGRTPGAS
jgi:hypothetical protein